MSTPSEAAIWGPSDIRFISRAKTRKTPSPAAVLAPASATSPQLLEAKLPISQKMMTATCSSATYFRKLMPAERIEATMMPERIRLLEDSPSADER